MKTRALTISDIHIRDTTISKQVEETVQFGKTKQGKNQSNSDARWRLAKAKKRRRRKGSTRYAKKT